MTSAICTDCNRSASAGNGLAPGKAAAPYGRSPHCRTASLSGTLFLLCFSGRGPKSGVAAAGWNRIRLFYHLLPPFGNRLWAKFSAFCCLYRKTPQKASSSPVLFFCYKQKLLYFSDVIYCKRMRIMLNYCVSVGAHIIDKVFFVQGQANCF